MAESNLFEEMLTTYPAEKRELAREVYHRFADGDSGQFFSQLFLVLDVYAHYAERIPSRMISASADSLVSLQEMREEIGLIAKTIESRDVNITNHAEKTDELCRVTVAKCNEATSRIESLMKNFGAQVDTQAIVQGINNTLESGIRKHLIEPFLMQTQKLELEVMPTLEKIQSSAREAKSEWSKRIWKTAWANSLLWSFTFALLGIALASWEIEKYYEHKMAGQIAVMTQVITYNQEAFRKLAIAQVPIQVLPTQSDGFDSPPGFVLVIAGAYAADMQQVNGQNNGCIFFNSSVPAKQIRHLQQEIENQSPATNGPAK